MAIKGLNKKSARSTRGKTSENNVEFSPKFTPSVLQSPQECSAVTTGGSIMFTTPTDYLKSITFSQAQRHIRTGCRTDSNIVIFFFFYSKLIGATQFSSRVFFFFIINFPFSSFLYEVH